MIVVTSGKVKIFVSHAHRDEDIADRLVLFELGAAWLQAKRTIPLLARLKPEDVPGPMRGAWPAN